MADEDFSTLHTPTLQSSENRVQKPGGGAPSNPSSGLNPRSCVTCRRRKVKCDKKQPCGNCVKAHIECIFPGPGRAPRKPRKPQDSEIMERLKRLEGVVQSLGTQVQPDDNESAKEEKVPDKEEEETHEQKLVRACRELRQLRREKMEMEGKKAESDGLTGLENRFGRLVVGQGRSRYIHASFWASLSAEVEDIKGVLDDSGDDDDDDYPSPVASNSSSNSQGFIFGLKSTSVDMCAFHPPKEHVPIYWNLFKENVDPLVKVLHCPSMEPIIADAQLHLNKLPKGLEVLMFAIYYGTVASLLPEQVRKTFGEERLDLLTRYKFGVQHALARADFLQTDEVIVLQAFVIFLMTLRRNDDARVIWTLTGLVVRMAQTLGLHRDGSHYENLSPFDVEMRRRLWWQSCILDSRASEDHGCDPTIIDMTTDTQFPRNVNDSDLHADMTELPENKRGCTEMTFGLVRFEITSALRKIQFVPLHVRKYSKCWGPHSVQKKENIIRELQQRLEERYLEDSDLSVPLYWVIATVTRLIISKMWLMVYHPFQRVDGGSSLPKETKDRLFKTALDNLEYALLLEQEERTKQFSWLFRTYVQWHAIAFLLSELCTRTRGPEVERTWRAIDLATTKRWEDELATNKLKSHLWKPLRRLMAKAKSEREKALAEDHAQSRREAQAPTTIPMNGATSHTTLPIDASNFAIDPIYPDPQGLDNVQNPIVYQTPGLNPVNTLQPQQVQSQMVFGIPGQSNPEASAIAQPDLMGNIAAPNAQFSSLQASGLGDEWMTNSPNDFSASSLFNDGTSINWASWDDMALELGMGSGAQRTGDQQDDEPSVFGGGTQWY